MNYANEQQTILADVAGASDLAAFKAVKAAYAMVSGAGNFWTDVVKTLVVAHGVSFARTSIKEAIADSQDDARKCALKVIKGAECALADGVALADVAAMSGKALMKYRPAKGDTEGADTGDGAEKAAKAAAKVNAAGEAEVSRAAKLADQRAALIAAIDKISAATTLKAAKTAAKEACELAKALV